MGTVFPLQSVASKWEINAMPTFVFLKKGKIIEKIVGADKVGLSKKIVELSGTTPAATSTA